MQATRYHIFKFEEAAYILVQFLYEFFFHFNIMYKLHLLVWGARCSSMVRVFTHGAMGRRIDPSWWTHWAISRFSQCPMTGVTKAVVYVIRSGGMMHIKELLLLIGKSSLWQQWVSSLPSGSLPYV